MVSLVKGVLGSGSYFLKYKDYARIAIDTHMNPYTHKYNIIHKIKMRKGPTTAVLPYLYRDFVTG